MFISNAYAAAGAPTGTENFMLQLVPMLIIGVLFWFMLVRPQQKRAKEQAELLKSLQKNDEVLTSAGFYGKVIKADEKHVWLEIAAETEIVVQRSAISGKLEAGTLKKLTK